MSSSRATKPRAVSSLLAGATGGLVVAVALQPLETLKTRSQLLLLSHRCSV